MRIADIRVRSKQLVHTEYRLEIAAAIARDPADVTALALATTTKIAYPRVVDELHRLRDAGMLVRESRPGPTAYYRAVDTVYYRLCAELLAELKGTSKG